MKLCIFILGTLLWQVASGDEGQAKLDRGFSREEVVLWCRPPRTQTDVKDRFGPNPIILGDLVATENPEEFSADAFRLTYPLESRENGRMAVGGSFEPGSVSLVFKFAGDSLTSVLLFPVLSEKPPELIWKKGEQGKDAFSLRLIRLSEGDEIRVLIYKADDLTAHDYRFRKERERILGEDWLIRRKDSNPETEYLVERFLKRVEVDTDYVKRLDRTIEYCRSDSHFSGPEHSVWVRFTYLRKGRVIGEEKWPYPYSLIKKEGIEKDQSLTNSERSERLDQLALSYELNPTDFEETILFRTVF